MSIEYLSSRLAGEKWVRWSGGGSHTAICHVVIFLQWWDKLQMVLQLAL